MKTVTSLITLIFLGFGLYSGPLSASDTEKEMRWRSQIVDGLIAGDAVDLQANTETFLGIYTEAGTDKPLGAAIVMHGTGVHPDWPDVILPLRSELPASGWATLSIQMPILANDAEHQEYAPLYAEVPARINAAIAFLQGKGFHNIVLIGHSLGSSMGASYLANGGKGISAFVAIGMSVEKEPHVRMDNVAFLGKITLPMLDLYGSQDLDGVRGSIELRSAAARKAGNKQYRQQEVVGANHFFQGVEGDLVRIVKGWLATHATGKTR